MSVASFRVPGPAAGSQRQTAVDSRGSDDFPVRSCGTCRCHLSPPGGENILGGSMPTALHGPRTVMTCRLFRQDRCQRVLVAQLAPCKSLRLAALWEIDWLSRGMRPMHLASSRGAPRLSLLCDASSQKHPRNCHGIPAIISPPYSPASSTNEKRVVTTGTSQ